MWLPHRLGLAAYRHKGGVHTGEFSLEACCQGLYPLWCETSVCQSNCEAAKLGLRVGTFGCKVTSRCYCFPLLQYDKHLIRCALMSGISSEAKAIQ